MGRSPCCSKEGLNKGAWTALEDKILKSYIKAHGEGNWRSLPKRAGLKRCGKSCRLRWLNYLRPDIKRGNISEDEEELIIRLHNLLGNRWSLIAGRLPGRTDNEIKNYWNTTLGKKAKLAKQSSSSSPPMSNIQTISKSQLGNTINSDQAKVIRTKATRCSTKVIVVPSPLPNTDHITDQNSPALLVEEPHDENSPVNDEALTTASLPPGEPGGQGLCDTTFEGRIGATGDQKWPESYSGDLSIEDLGLSLPFDIHEPGFDDWFQSSTTFTTCLDQEDNATLDLDSLAFLLDSEEWPGN